MQKSYLKLNLIILLSFFLSFSINAQKPLDLTINIPPAYDISKVQLSLDDGNGFTQIMHPQIKGHSIVLTRQFYSIRPAVMINYTNKKDLYSGSNFFISDKPATITFLETPGESLDSSSTINASTFWNSGMDKLYSFAAKEMEAQDNLIRQNNGNLQSDSLTKLYIMLAGKVLKKKLEFISRYGNLYYSLWTFRNYFAANNEYSPDTLLGIFNKAFPEKFKESYDGKTIQTILNGRINTIPGHQAPDFVSTDIYGKELSLKQYRGKYVLLDFWASWCVPCIAELPTIANIRDSIPGSKLEIILASYDDDSTQFINAVKKYNLNYEMIYGDHVLINEYGGKPGIPQTYLIDPSGNLIYSREDEKDYDQKMLRKVLFDKLR